MLTMPGGLTGEVHPLTRIPRMNPNRMDWATDEQLTAFLKRIGTNIRFLRVARDLAQDTLARVTGLQASHVSRLENATGRQIPA